METENNQKEKVSPIERLRRRLHRKLGDLEYGLEKLEQDEAPDAEWARLVYQQHIERCHHWLKTIEQVG